MKMSRMRHSIKNNVFEHFGAMLEDEEAAAGTRVNY